ncbi:hypothetical protein PVA45_05050 [Entomospira entomophila]|uniref:Peptidase S9 prolyl oligopeptidase catalytic domain-containing protein n=1 Tax=Entomospira entomophila TaxID=2719988 RepID=A0A968GA70_9SPIO|nr:hypothetical protein [Entomospira entomophilus]NIZ40866.1 hypothetical protein [Entomospira entomophilus]WDI35079.1 hypothetical protein PVA45_05050 [Entomospira entomophilus]
MRKNKISMIIILTLLTLPSLSAQLRYNYQPYTFQSLQSYPFKASSIILHSVIEDTPEYISYIASFTTMNRHMSLFFAIPKLSAGERLESVTIMLRDFHQHYTYSTGISIQSIAKEYLRAGIAVIAPDFFGFADSAEPPLGTANSAEAYLIMPINTAELYLSLSNNLIIHYETLAERYHPNPANITFKNIALWGHGDGGLTALHTLVILQEPIPTILWAPVSLDFANAWAFSRAQYSAIASKNAKQFVTEFERNYRISHYNIKENLDSIAPRTPIFLHHGENDNNTPVQWSHTLIKAISAENSSRNNQGIEPILFQYTMHPFLDHQLQPLQAQIILNDIAWMQQAFHHLIA